MIQRTFITGSEWLYYKIYCGPKTADRILREIIKPASEMLLNEKIIDSWFFIRYTDPKQHLRVRFHHSNNLQLNKTIHLLHSLLVPHINTGLIWKVITDTYNRELERYGASVIEKTEQILFFYDSVMIVNILCLIEGDEGEKLRWIFGLKAIDDMLDSFGYNDEKKLDFLQILRDNFSKEFGMDKDLKKQLSEKYRYEKKNIESIMNKEESNKYISFLNHLNERRKNIIPFVDDLKKSESTLEVPINQLLMSYLHMMCNRLFKSKQRLPVGQRI